MPQQPFSDAFSAHSQNKQNASQARRAAEALFQSSENSTPSRARRAQKRPIRAVSNITSVRRYVFSRLLHLARYSRQLEFVELPRSPGKALSDEVRNPVFVLLSGPGGRSLYLSLEDADRPAPFMPAWWERLEVLGHPQQRVRARSAVEAWSSVERVLKNIGFTKG